LPSGFIGPIADGLVSWRRLAALVALLLLIPAAPVALRLRFDRSVAAIFKRDDPLLQGYQQLRRDFGGNEIVLMVYRDSQLLDPNGQGLKRLEAITTRIEPIEGVTGVLSLHQVNRAMGKLRAGPLALLQPSNDSAPVLLEPNDPLAQSFRELFAGYTHSRDGQWSAIGIMLTRGNQHAIALDQLRTIARSLPEPLEPALLVGEPVLVDEGFALVEADGQRLGTVTLVLMAIVLLLALRSLRWMLAPLLVVGWSILITRALLVWFGLRLTLVSSLLTAIIAVIGVATVLHFAVTYQRYCRQGWPPEQAARRTFRSVLAPTMWAIATDMAGFGALMLAGVQPVRQFGLMMSLAALVVLVGTVLITPQAMLIGTAAESKARRWLGRRAQDVPFSAATRSTMVLRRIDRSLRRIATWPMRFLSRRTARIGVVFGLAAFLVASIGNIWLQSETDFTRNFRSDYELVRAYQQVEQHLGGAGVWDVLLPAPRELNDDYFASVRALEEKLRAIRVEVSARDRLDQNQQPIGLSKVLSIADADHATRSEPLLQAITTNLRVAGMRSVMKAFAEALVTYPTSNDQPRGLRIMLRSREQIPSAAKQQLISRVRQVVDDHVATPQWASLLQSGPDRPATDDASVRGQVTGYHVLLTQLVESLLADQWRCLAGAVTGVALLLLAATRSLRLASVALLLNILPALVVLGAIGWTGQRVNLGAAMIAAVSVGLTIDGSLHWLHGFQSSRRRGRSIAISRIRASGNVGLPVLVATAALVIGFGTLWTSPFLPTATFGTLVSAALGLGALVNLTLLPAMVGND
jgi:uncharacterized protein